jgi:hypothetical protein
MYKVVSLYQIAGQNQNLLAATKSFENVAKCKYFEVTVTSKIAFKKILKSDYVLGMLATILFREFCIPTSSLKT